MRDHWPMFCDDDGWLTFALWDLVLEATVGTVTRFGLGSREASSFGPKTADVCKSEPLNTRKGATLESVKGASRPLE